MNIEPNNPKLKLAIARMLPESIASNGYGEYFWIDDNKTPFAIRETEWLYIVSLVEKTLNRDQLWEYVEYIDQIDDVPAIATATFNQRATALCRVKGITIE